jgi:hypothetical protein
MGKVLMSFAYYSEGPSITREQIDRLSKIIDAQHGPGFRSEGALFHANGPTDDGGWWSFDLFESAEHFERYRDTILAPAAAQAGLPAPDARRLGVAWDSLQVEGTDGA